ncbi:putative glycerol kinase 5 [Ceratitis capitata]|uniref:Glycerol kinase 5 n=1 Tax=Ceratitis capitata TaxID=7213 RepID=W8CB84_CERCA|nr:putative glycerol kinase 5 [Ceratitis capitata]XP_012158063.1 putative glycerol kinase 5 [Ceratitis capitata]XP_020714995.1 putative glycerol kinase 5 [Ceratitis capitata]XP_020714996.1 putative glycerol kinase 5 [Ceratitis capitata]
MVFVATLDVGTTTVRCFIFNAKCEVLGSSTERVDLLNPQPGYFEIEPESLWRKIVKVINAAVVEARLKPTDITSFGLSTQRCTFLTWNHETQEYYHNFITWKDLRANELVDQWNAGMAIKSLNIVSYGLYLLTRSNRFLAASVLKMMNGQITLRLLHSLENNPRLREALKRKKARVELLDSWILYKLRSGNGIDKNIDHISDITSATATGLFDPFTLSWSPLGKVLFGIEPWLLPKVVDNGYRYFGHIHPNALGPEWQNTFISIEAAVSDQTAALWGSQCFERGDVKITLGTGAFLNLNTGNDCHASLMGMYPLVAWQFRDIQERAQTVYCVEGASHDMGTVIEWAQQCGFFTSPMETSAIAESVSDTNGVYFIPSFSGLGPPINDHRAASGFIGITPSTTREHLVRAILESIVFRIVQLCETVEKESKYTLRLLRVDGGVSHNDFVCQLLADATGSCVERATSIESSILGATYMVGYNCGLWNSFDKLRRLRQIERTFMPRPEYYTSIRKHIVIWLKAIERFKNCLLRSRWNQSGIEVEASESIGS